MKFRAPAGFRLAFWPGLATGVALAVEGAAGAGIFPAWAEAGIGKDADGLGLNLYGLLLCTGGFLAGRALGRGRGAR